MTRKPKSKPKSKTKPEECDTPVGVDDRHLPHPDGVAVDPAGGAVFEGSGDSTRAGPEKPTKQSDKDAVGFAVFGECPDPSEDDSFGGGDGVGAVVSDDCEDPSDSRAKAATAARRGAAKDSVDDGMGAAVFPDGRIAGNVGERGEVREGYGLVFR